VATPPTPTSPTAGAPLKLILVLGSLIALGPLTIDMYLPALPDIERDLLTTSAAVQLTLTGTLLGLAAGQLLVGPLSDALGRRRPLIAGTMVHVVASLACVVAPNVAALGTLRVLQGVGAASASVVTLAVVRDLYDGRAAATLLSRLMLVLGVGPVLAPSLGGAVLQWTTWRGVFVILAAMGVALTVVAHRFLPETLPAERRRPGGLAGTVRSFRILARDGVFVGLVLVAGLSMAALFAYVSGSSFVLQDQYGLSEQQYAVVFGLGSIGLIAGTQVNARLLHRYAPQQLLLWALVGGTAASVVMLATAISGLGGLVGVLVPLWVVLAATGVAMPNAPALALSRHGEVAGTAAALLGAVRFSIGAVAAPFVGLLGNNSAAMATIVVISMAAAVAVLVVAVSPSRLLAPDTNAVATAD
jgi:DHA1 family bicyclomycin/chloramphenicol resistance-like MFS transporter